MKRMLAWAMLSSGRSRFRFVRAEAPCWKGEIVLPLVIATLVIGWQAGEEDRS